MSQGQKPVLIAGAGLASLLVARALRRADIPFRGYRLRLSNEGLDAIEAVLGPEAFKKFYDACGKTGGAGFAAMDPLTGEILENHVSVISEPLTSRGGKVVGVSRGDMRTLFMEGCEDSITWSRHIIGYERTEHGVVATFADGSKSEEGSMLIGGEGIKSAVAKQLTNGANDLGSRGIHGQAPTTAFKGLGEGVWRMIDEKSHPNGGSISLITNVRAQDMKNPDIIFGWTMGGTASVIKAPNDDYTVIGKQAARIAKELTKDWYPRIKPLFDNMQESEAAFWKITCSSPDGVPDWPNDPRVTLIVNAVHAMIPAGGNGANTAVRDSAPLGRLLAEAGGFTPGLTAAYEREMRAYASGAVKQSFAMAQSHMAAEIDIDTPLVS